MENINNEVMEAEVQEEVKESKIKGFASKVGAGIKKHGKKIAVGTAIVGGALVLAALKGRNANCGYESDEDEAIDVEYSEEN